MVRARKNCGDLDPRDFWKLQPELPCLPFDLKELVDEVRTNHFPEIVGRVSLWFAPISALACITKRDGEARIFSHVLLNHSQTPREVMHFVITHELLHIRIPSREVDGEWKSHPPEFWEAESTLVPDKELLWNWIWYNFGEVLRERRKLECIEIRKRWRPFCCHPRASLPAVADFLARGTAARKSHSTPATGHSG